MAHEITLNKNGSHEFVASSHVSVWHGLGQRHEGLMTVEKALEESSLGFTVSKRDLYTTGNDGEQILIPGRVAIVRDDTDLILSVMSDSYAVIQNEYTAELIKAMVGQGASVATAGSLHGGKKIFFQMEVGDSFFVGNRTDEEVQKFLLVGNSHDGSTAQYMMSTPHRVVCQNTLNAALGSAKNIVKVYHRKGYASKAQEAVRLLGIADEYYESFKASANRLIELEVTSTYVEGFINSLLPAEADENGDIATRTSNRREEVKNLFANGIGNHGKTRWDLFNAVTEFVDHKQGGRVTQKRLNLSAADTNIEGEQRLERAIFGSGASFKQKAMDLLLA
jgi:phage/plasmid-like protein (TIGR03299 family)